MQFIPSSKRIKELLMCSMEKLSYSRGAESQTEIKQQREIVYFFNYIIRFVIFYYHFYECRCAREEAHETLNKKIARLSQPSR